MFLALQSSSFCPHAFSQYLHSIPRPQYDRPTVISCHAKILLIIFT
jgi:hypothetical protein